MKHILALFLCLATAAAVAQTVLPIENHYFEFSPPKKRRPVESLYHIIGFLDSRRDTSSIGPLERGSKKTVLLVLKTPVQPQLANFLLAYSTHGSGSRELLFQLRRYSWAEPRKTRYVYLAGTLYVRNGDQYTRLANLDTAISMNAPSFFEQDLGARVNEVFGQFIARNIGVNPAGGPSYGLGDLGRIDSLEKRQIPVYNTANYVDGFYGNYTAFKDQRPDIKGHLKLNDDGSISKLVVDDPVWKMQQHAHIYAFVYKGVPYVVTHYGYFLLEKKDDEFYFTGPLRVNATDGEVAVGEVAFGLVGRGIVTDTGDKNFYRVLIDHENGEFIHLETLTIDAE
jgi:hypothetical protein